MTEEDKWTLITQLATALQDRGRQVDALWAENMRLKEMINSDERAWMEKLAQVEQLEAENARLQRLVAGCQDMGDSLRAASESNRRVRDILSQPFLSAGSAKED